MSKSWLFRSFTIVTKPLPGSAHATAYRPDIDGLRAIAVLAVVAFHTFPSTLPSGYFGVDVFFVISGYLISRILFADLQRGRFSIGTFYARRVRRIFPALLTVLAACFVVGFRCLLADELKELGKHIAAGSVFLSNVVLWQEAGYFDKAAELKPLLHLWSLGVEEQFYIVWPLTLLALWKRPRLMLGTIALVVLVSFGLNLSQALSASAKFYLPFTRFWELCAGGALAYQHHIRPGQVPSPVSTFQNLMAVLGVVMMTGAISLLDQHTPHLAWWSIAPTLGALLVIAAPQTAWTNRVILSQPALVAVGLISYPLYLWHWPIITFLRIQGVDTQAPAKQAIKLGVMFLLAGLTYQLVEKPIRARPRARWTLPALGSLMVLMGAAGAYVVMQDGISNRFAAEAQRLASFKYPKFREDGRKPACWLRAIDSADGFAPECVERATHDSQPLVVLWGDSHAALLYPGVQAVQKQHNFRLAQFTRSSCPPLANHDCATTNAWVMQQLAILKPDAALLASNWAEHWQGEGAHTLRALENTIVTLKQTGTHRVVVIGPMPQWQDGLPRALFNFYRQDFPLHRMPDRMHYALVPLIPQIDEALRNVALRHQATYVSARDLMCTETGCLTYVGGKPTQLTAWDSGHLTKWGSKYLVGRFPEAVWKAPVTAPILRFGPTR